MIREKQGLNKVVAVLLAAFALLLGVLEERTGRVVEVDHRSHLPPPHARIVV
jgi:hypothetical protein